MSYDFNIYLQNEPKLNEIISTLAQLKMAVEHSPTALPWEFKCYMGQDGSELSERESFKVIGPVSIFPDDLPSFSSSNDLDRAKWLITVSCQVDSEVAEQAVKFGSALVKNHKGAIYDPQEDQLVYPKKVPRKAESREIKLLSMQFSTTEEEFLPAKAKVLLDILEEYCPEALPMRFGRGLPLSDRYLNLGASGFLNACKREGTLFFRGRYPFLGGGVWRPSEFTRLKATEAPCVTISLDFDCSWALGSSENSEHLVALFCALAEGIGCFYAGAAVRRRVNLVDGEILHGPEAENWSFGRAACWDGIPMVKTWLTWFGADLKLEVAPCLDQRYVTMEGSFMRLTEKPADADELTYLFPKFPDKVLNVETASGHFKTSG